MPLDELALELNEDLLYRITVIESVRKSSTKSAFSIAPPGLPASDNLLLGVQGMEADISIDFSIHDDGTDKSDGTATSPVVSIDEQIQYLENDIHAADFEASWTLDDLTGNAFDDDEVFLENVSVTHISRESPRWKPATLEIRRGGSIG